MDEHAVFNTFTFTPGITQHVGYVLCCVIPGDSPFLKNI